MSLRSRRLLAVSSTALVVLTVTAACGTRIPHAKVVAANGGGLIRVAAGSAAADGSTAVGASGDSGDSGDTSGQGGQALSSDPAVAADQVAAGQNPAGAGGAGSSSGGATVTPGAAGVPSASSSVAPRSGSGQVATRGGGPTAAPGKSQAATKPGTGSGTAAPKAGSSQAAAGSKGDTSPINLGMIGDFTNSLTGSAAGQAKDSILAWASDENAKGGVDGHQIVMSIEDDQSSSTVALQDAQDLVQNKHVIAFVGNYTSYNSAIEPYVRGLNIPIIGGFVSENVWGTSPVMFGQQAGPKSAGFTEGTIAVKEANGNVGVIYCAENPSCQTIADSAKDPSTGVAQAGAHDVYSASASVAQPDFTTECLAAQNAKVGYLFVLMDTASIKRVASSCAQQGYRPLFSSGVNDDSLGTDANLNDHYAQISQTFTWTQTATPSEQAYQAWSSQFGLPRGLGSVAEWLAGSIFQRGMKGITGPVTGAQLIQNLHTVANEGFDGLIPGSITFTANGTPGLSCLYVQTLKSGHLVDDFGGKAICNS